MAVIGMVRRGAGISPRRGRAFAAVLMLLAAGQGTARAAPFISTDDKFVLEHIPEARDTAGTRLRALHTALLADPANLDLALRTAEADLAQARAHGDPRFLGRADAALAPWPLGPATPPQVLLLRGTMLQSTHQFDASLVALDQLLRAQPENSQAWLTRAAVHQAQGRIDAARDDCGHYATVAIGLLADSCIASVMAASGHATMALRALTLALGTGAGEQAAARLYALTIAAETASALGDATAADRFGQALVVAGSDPYLLAAWSDFLLDHGRSAEIVPLLQGSTRIDPLLLRLALAERALGRQEADGHIADLAARFDAARSRGDTVHRREEARFRLYLAHDAAGALTLAQANWDVQREPADARILLEAALAARDIAVARPVAQWMHDTGLEDVRLAALLARLATMEASHGRA
jgi:tetratricopeptide (TPR) repeat protein